MWQMIAQAGIAAGNSLATGLVTRGAAKAEQLLGNARTKTAKEIRKLQAAATGAQSNLARTLQSLRNQRASKQAAAVQESTTRTLMGFKDATSAAQFSRRLEASAGMGAEAVRSASLGVVSDMSATELNSTLLQGLQEAAVAEQREREASVLQVRRKDAASGVPLATDFSVILPGLERGLIAAPQINVPKMGDLLLNAATAAGASVMGGGGLASFGGGKSDGGGQGLGQGVRLGEQSSGGWWGTGAPRLGEPNTGPRFGG